MSPEYILPAPDLKILIIIPAFNECQNIMNVISDINKFCPYADKIVINDASTDDTKKILIENAVPFLDLSVNLGIGGGVQTGYIYAEENNYDIAIQMDGDNQHCAEEISKIIDPIQQGKADIVIGSRFINNDSFQSSFIRRIGINSLSYLIFACSGQHIKDVTSGFRAVNKKFIKIYAQDYAQDYPEPEAIMVAANYGAIIEEVPVVMKERINGQSSITFMKSIYYMVKVSLAILFKKLF